MKGPPLLVEDDGQVAEFIVAELTAAGHTCVHAPDGEAGREAAGIADSPDQFFADALKKTRGKAHPTVTRALVDVAPALVEWLADDVGVPLDLVVDFNYPGHTLHRCHAVSPKKCCPG